MSIKRYLTAATLATVVASSSWAITESTDATFSKEQVTTIEGIIHQYLLNNPEVLIEVSQILEKTQQQKQQKEAKSSILQQADNLLSETLAVAGNPKGNVTLIEFFDNQCGHCKQMKPVVAELIQKNPDLRVVYKEFPIFGKTSEDASKIALAAAIQGKYIELHDALLAAKEPLNEASTLKIASSIGLDVKKLKVDMNSKVVATAIKANRKLANALHLMGTPAFIVLSTPEGKFDPKTEPTFIPGAATVDTLQAVITKASGK